MITLELDDILKDGTADTVLYNDGTGSVSVSGVVNYWTDGAAPGDQAHILVKKSQVPDPDYRHTFTIDGVVWYVRADKKDKGFILAQGDNFYLLALSKNERFSQWRT